MSEQDREIVVETVTVETAPPELQSPSLGGGTQTPPDAAAPPQQPTNTTDASTSGETTEQGAVDINTAAAAVPQQPPSTDLSRQTPSITPQQQSAVDAPAPSGDSTSAFSAQAQSTITTSASSASANMAPAAPAADPATPLPIQQLERLSISEASTEGLVESPATISPLAAARPSMERTETGSTNESRKHTALPPVQTEGLLSPISAGPSLLSSTYSLRKGAGDSGRALRGARHWSREDIPPHSPEEGLGKDSMVIQCDNDESEEDACHGTVSVDMICCEETLTRLIYSYIVHPLHSDSTYRIATDEHGPAPGRDNDWR